MTTPWQRLRTLDPHWIALLRDLDADITRSHDGFVAWRGRTHTLEVAFDDDLDPDDTLAQIVLHELCHHLIEGPQSWHQDDWGLDNMTQDSLPNEHAALRLQATLLSTPLLRTYLQPTTVHRSYYDRLDGSPLDQTVDPKTDSTSRIMAHRGWRQYQQWPHMGALHALLKDTDAFLSCHCTY